MCIKPVESSVVSTFEDRAVHFYSNHIVMHARDIAALISSSCSSSSSRPLERIVDKVVNTAGNAIQALRNLQYDTDLEGNKGEFQHAHRIIRSSPLKALQDDMFASCTHFATIAPAVVEALTIIRNEFQKNAESVSSSLKVFITKKEGELSPLLKLPLNQQKLRSIGREFAQVIVSIEDLLDCEKDADIIDPGYESTLKPVRNQLKEILNYIDLCYISGQIEEYELTTPESFSRFFLAADQFNCKVREWRAFCTSTNHKCLGVDRSFYRDALEFTKPLSEQLFAKFCKGFPHFCKIVERMKELTERKHLAVFSPDREGVEENIQKLDDEVLDLDKIFRDALKFLGCFRADWREKFFDFVFTARYIKKNLLDPLPKIKRELRDCFDLKSGEILVELKNPFMHYIKIYQRLQLPCATITEKADFVTLYASLERVCENVVKVINEKFCKILDEEIPKKQCDMGKLFSQQTDPIFVSQMQGFISELVEMRQHLQSLCLTRSLFNERDVKIRQMLWACRFIILERKMPEILDEVVDLVDLYHKHFQSYTEESKSLGALDPILDAHINDSYNQNIAFFKKGIISSLQNNTHTFGQQAIDLAAREVSSDLGKQIQRIHKKYINFKSKAHTYLKRINTSQEDLIVDIDHVQDLFVVIYMACYFQSYADATEDKSIGAFLIKQKKFYDFKQTALSYRSSLHYGELLRKNIEKVEGIVRREIESYLATLISSVMALSDEIEGSAMSVESDGTLLQQAFYKRIQELEKHGNDFMDQACFVSATFTHVKEGIRNLKIRFQQDALRGARQLLSTFQDSMRDELSKFPAQAEIYSKKVETFYAEYIVCKLFGEHPYSPEAIYLFKEKERMLREISERSLATSIGSPDTGHFPLPLSRVESCNLLENDTTICDTTVSSEALESSFSASPQRPISAFPA